MFTTLFRFDLAYYDELFKLHLYLYLLVPFF
ncbi:MAG: hypothetical protein JO235_20190 [Chroococcidiopsidaceae cyanobacterium CP_BM_RX_35]|nr:hypothetical protein [Chroococcidiopsidaceae cyanobacterium CP_BM_RX_35]